MGNNIFNRKLLKLQQEKAIKDFTNSSYLYNWTNDILFENFCDRFSLSNINNQDKKFNIYEIGAKNYYLTNLIDSFFRSKLSENDCKNFDLTYWHSNLSEKFYHQNNNQQKNQSNFTIRNIVADEQFLPFSANSFDVIFTNLNFHFLNYPELFLLQIQKILKKDGILLISYFGEENLSALYLAIKKAQFAIYQGNFAVKPPVINLGQITNMLKTNNFSDIVTNHEELTISYSNIKQLLIDISSNAQGNFLYAKNSNFVSKRFFDQIEYHYCTENQKTVDCCFKINIAVAKKSINK